MKFRTPYNLGDYEDKTMFPSEDLVDTRGYEPLHDIIARMLRGELKYPSLGSYDFKEEEGEELLEDFSDIEDISEVSQKSTELSQILSERASKKKETPSPSDSLKNVNPENLEEKKSGSDAKAAVSATGAAAPRPEV